MSLSESYIKDEIKKVNSAILFHSNRLLKGCDRNNIFLENEIKKLKKDREQLEEKLFDIYNEKEQSKHYEEPKHIENFCDFPPEKEPPKSIIKKVSFEKTNYGKKIELIKELLRRQETKMGKLIELLEIIDIFKDEIEILNFIGIWLNTYLNKKVAERDGFHFYRKK